MSLRVTPLKKQVGAVLLILMLVLVAGSGYFLSSRLNTNLTRSQHDEAEVVAMEVAKDALIGYAITYPDTHDFGPGYLPCPDKHNDGEIDGSCSPDASFPMILGRLPFKSLELEESKDASGEVFWYALSNNFRNNPKVIDTLNSDILGQLTVDDEKKIVAIIFAPGKPVNAQVRSSLLTDQQAVSNYLEGENRDGDASFFSLPRIVAEDPANNIKDLTVNDRLITITQKDLLKASAKRVLGDVRQALLKYQAGHGTFPWLSPFADPPTSAYRGQVGTHEGHIPFHWTDDPHSQTFVDAGGAGPVFPGRNPFQTAISVSWNSITNANIQHGGTVELACLQDISDCDYGGVFGGITELDKDNVACTWTNGKTIDCESFEFIIPPRPYTQAPTCSVGVINRTYKIDFPVLEATGTSTGTTTTPSTLEKQTSYSGGTVTITPATATSTRLREVARTVVVGDKFPDKINVIEIIDTFTGDGIDSASGTGVCESLVDFDVGTGTLNFGFPSVTPPDPNIAQGTLVARIQYDLDIDGLNLNPGTGASDDSDFDDLGEFPPELPAWFFKNKWHELIYIAYAPELIPGGTTACTPGTDCLVLNNSGIPNNNKRALAILAGNILTVNTPRDSTVLPAGSTVQQTAYFEGQNASTGDDIFEQGTITDSFNDQVRVILP